MRLEFSAGGRCRHVDMSDLSVATINGRDVQFGFRVQAPSGHGFATLSLSQEEALDLAWKLHNQLSNPQQQSKPIPTRSSTRGVKM